MEEGGPDDPDVATSREPETAAPVYPRSRDDEPRLGRPNFQDRPASAGELDDV